MSERADVARSILIVAALLGIVADTTLRLAPGGLGWTLWIAALAVAAAIVAKRRALEFTRERSTWLALALIFAAAFAWRDAGELRAGNVFGTLCALALFAMSAAGLPAPSVLAARVRDVIAAAVYSAFDAIGGAPALAAFDSELLALSVRRGGRSATVLRALLLTVPLVFVFTILLSRADPVFASIFSLPDIDVGTIVSHVMLAGFFAWISAGWMRGALLAPSSRSPLPDRLPLQLGAAEITTSLGAVIILFAIFVALQIRWLFGGGQVVLATTGLTLAQYARRGFFELVAVAVLVLPLLLVTRALIDDRVARRHRQLSLALIALVGAIMVSALLRMRLYVEHFGLSTDRLFATALMVWLGVVFAALAVTALAGRPRHFAAVAVVSGFAVMLALDVANPELMVARVNLARPSDVRAIDYGYLARLSGDAAPTVVSALAAAAPTADGCAAAKLMRKEWLSRYDSEWNLGSRSGRDAVVAALSPTTVLRLCGAAPPANP